MSTRIAPLAADELTTDHIHELIELQDRVAPDLARIAELEKFLKGLEPGKYSTGSVELTVSPSKRFNKNRFKETFPYEKYPQFYRTAEPDVDPKTIAPSVKDQFSDAYDNRLKIS